MRKELVGLDELGPDRHRQERAARRPPDLQIDRLTHLAAKGLDRGKGPAVGRQDLVTDQKPCPGGGEAVEPSAHKDPAIELAGEDPDAGIDHPAVGEEPRQVAPQAMGEDVHQLIIGGLGGRIETGVRGAEGCQHAVDDGGTVGPRRRLAIVRPPLVPGLVPADRGQVAQIEIVADDAPGLVEESAVARGPGRGIGRGIGHAVGEARRRGAAHDQYG